MEWTPQLNSKDSEDQFAKEAKRYIFSQIESQKVASVHADGDDEHYDDDDDDDDESNVDVDDGEDDFGIVILLHRSVEELVIRINQCFRYSNVPV